MNTVETHPQERQRAADGDTVFPDILSLLRHKAAGTPGAPALEDASGLLETYDSLRERIESLAAALIRHGLAVPGECRRIGLVLPNGPDMSRALLACCSVATVIPLNPAYTAAEFDDYYRELGITSLIVSREIPPHAATVAKEQGIAICLLEDLFASPNTEHLEIPAPHSDAVAMILLTSGSTGRCKKVPLTHRNVCTSARDVCHSLALGPGDRCLSMWELFHIGGLVDLLLAPLHSGGTVIATGGFSADVFFGLLEQCKPTWFQGVPTSLGELLVIAKRKNIQPQGSSLRFLRSVAAALPPAQMLELEALFGVPVIQTFGMTEAGPLITSTQLPPSTRKPGSVGVSCGTEVGIFSADGKRITDGSSGEVAIRGDNVFSGYEGDDAANAAAFFDGWFRTGDMGRVDEDGHLFLTGRIKELINRGGEKINPSEVDRALLTHPAVREAASFCVSHRTLGEDVAAAVVRKDDATVGVRDLRQHLSQHLVAFKIPQRILFVDTLPRNAVGKVDRLALTALAEKESTPPPQAAGELTDVERRIAAIWATELNVPEVHPLDDFFRIGGDSLSGLRMFLAVEAAFAIKLPPDVLSHLTTVRELAHRLQSDGVSCQITIREGADMPSEAEQRQIIAVMEMGDIPTLGPGSAIKIINPQGKRPPLIWCFNIPALELRMMARFIDPDQPVYGLFSGGRLFNRGDEKLQELARFYLAELMEVFPTGSFHLGGNCQGGRIAYMLAQMLEEQGREVATLIGHEFCNANLTTFRGRLLLMFPKYGRRKFYERIRWGAADWEKPFAVRPVVCWIDGPHGGFFRDDGTRNLVRNVEAFLAGKEITEGTLDSPSGRFILNLRRIPVLFQLYRGYCKLVGFLRFGRRKKFHPFSGEELPRPLFFRGKNQPSAQLEPEKQ